MSHEFEPSRRHHGLCACGFVITSMGLSAAQDGWTAHVAYHQQETGADAWMDHGLKVVATGPEGASLIRSTKRIPVIV